MKNWKSTGSFFVFVGAYIYTLVTSSDPSTVETAGYVALISSLFMMFRSDISKDMVKLLIENISKKV